jgi:hypothetical protein
MSDYHGVPKAIGKPRRDTGLPPVDQVQESWLLELLGWQLHERLAAKLDLHGHRATRPPCLLNSKDAWVCLDLMAALRDLRSRPRAFSQQAGRYAELVRGAQMDGKRVVIELVDAEGEPSEADLKLVEALAKYLDAEMRVIGPAEIQRILAGARYPEHLCARNPLAWAHELAQARELARVP